MKNKFLYALGAIIIVVIVVSLFQKSSNTKVSGENSTLVPEIGVKNTTTVPILQETPFTKSGSTTSGPAYDLYQGQVLISGQYDYTEDPNSFGGTQLCFTADQNTAKKIPRDSGDSRAALFCFFSNPDKAIEQFGINLSSIDHKQYCGIKGRATIWIKDYSLLRAEIGGFDSSKLVSVANKSDQKLVACWQN